MRKNRFRTFQILWIPFLWSGIVHAGIPWLSVRSLKTDLPAFLPLEDFAHFVQVNKEIHQELGSLFLNLGEQALSEGILREKVLPGVKYLNLSRSSFDPKWLELLPVSIETLDLSRTKFEDENLSHLLHLKNLKHLNLGGNWIGPAGAKIIQDFTRLNSLILEDNALGDEGARSIAQMEQLLSLDISSNQVGDEGAEALSHLKHLQRLKISKNQISHLGANALIGHLQQLKVLDGSINPIREIDSKLARESQLTGLSLAKTHLSGENVQFIGEFRHLRDLNLSGIILRKVEFLSLLPDLHRLNLSGCGLLEESIAAVAGLRWLKELNLENSGRLSIEGLKKIALLENLETLNLDATRLQDLPEEMAQLTRLKSLSISDNTLSEKSISILSRLKGLTSLRIESAFQGPKPIKTLTSLTQLESLQIQGNKIGVEGASSLAAFPLLRHLGVASNELTDEGVSFLSSLKNLESLDLSFNQLSHLSFIPLSSLPRLRSLNIGKNPLGSSRQGWLTEFQKDIDLKGLKGLSLLSGVTSLDLSSSGVSDNDLKEVIQLQKLRNLDLKGNALTDIGLIQISKLENLRSLNLLDNSWVYHQPCKEDPDAIEESEDHVGFRSLAGLRHLHQISLDPPSFYADPKGSWLELWNAISEVGEIRPSAWAHGYDLSLLSQTFPRIKIQRWRNIY